MAARLDLSMFNAATRNKLKKAAREWVAREEIERDRAAAEREAKAHLALVPDPTEEAKKLWQAEEMARCAADPVHWFNTWVWTYNPKIVGRRDPETGEKLSPFLRFKLWPKQVEFIHWISARMDAEEQGLCEKSRDAGVSYLCVGFALHQWLYNPGFSATFGSRKVDYVDKKNNPNSLFHKMRIMLDRLPEWMLPEGFDRRKHDTKLMLFNPANEAVITGEGGENMGRGGRSTLYVLDEAAHVDNADAIEAALTGNTDCIIWVSSVNGTGNLFYKKRHGGGEDQGLRLDQIFRFHYTDDPRKTPEWVKAKKRQTTAVAWAQEYEIDYSASLEGVCIKAKHVRAAQELYRMVKAGKLAFEIPQATATGLDVGAGGKGRSIAVTRAGPWVYPPKSRREADTTGTAIWGYDCAQALGSPLINYDAPGVGAGVKSTFKHVKREGVKVAAINTGSDPFVVTGKWDDGRRSEEQFVNLKAEIWWMARTRFEKAYQLWLYLTGEEDDEGVEGRNWPIQEVVMLPSGDPDSDMLAVQLSMVKVNIKEDGRAIMEKKTELAKRGVSSPDYADAYCLSLVIRRTAYDPQKLAA
jgi:hypothetical protein